MEKRKRSARLPRSKRREQLIGIARSVFAERGYEATTLEEIAEKAGVSRPILYNHFGDKQTLFQQVVDHEIGHLQGHVRVAIVGRGDPRARLEQGLRAFFAYVQEHPEGHVVLTRDAPQHLSQSGIPVMLRGLAAAITSAFASGLDVRGLDSRPAAIYAQVVIGLAVHIGRWWLQHPEFKLDEVVRSTAGVLWSGFGHLDELERMSSEAEAHDAGGPAGQPG